MSENMRKIVKATCEGASYDITVIAEKLETLSKVAHMTTNGHNPKLSDSEQYDGKLIASPTDVLDMVAFDLADVSAKLKKLSSEMDSTADALTE